MIGSSICVSKLPSWPAGQLDALAAGPGQRERFETGRIKPRRAGRARHYLDRADVFAHRGHRHAAEQKLQLLRDAVRIESDRLGNPPIFRAR